MKSSINVALWDKDIYLLKAIRVVFEEYFLEKNISVTFRTLKDINLADWVVTTSTPRANGEKKSTKIIIRKNLDRETIYQKEISLGAEVESLKKILDTVYTASLENIYSERLSRSVITRRERQILQALATQLSVKQIADFLGLSRKTVCTHKYTAMKKLGFKRTNDLYHWLLLGGLQVEEDESENT